MTKQNQEGIISFLPLFNISYNTIECFFDTIIYPIYLFLFPVKPRLNPKLKEAIFKNAEECRRMGRELKHVIFPDTEKINKFDCVISTWLLFLFIGIIETIIFFQFLNGDWLFNIFLFFIFCIVLIITFILITLYCLWGYYFSEYEAKNNCYFITQSYLYHFRKQWTICELFKAFYNYGKVECKIFEIIYIYQVSYYIPFSYQFCQMNDMGVVKMLVHHLDYIREIEQEEEKIKRKESNLSSFISKITTAPKPYSAKVAPFEIYTVSNPEKITEDLNFWGRKLRKEN